MNGENFPYKVKIIKPQRFLNSNCLAKEHRQLLKREEIIKWCYENFIEGSWDVSPVWANDIINKCKEFSFKYEKDAMHFKLVWLKISFDTTIKYDMIPLDIGIS